MQSNNTDSNQQQGNQQPSCEETKADAMHKKQQYFVSQLVLSFSSKISEYWNELENGAKTGKWQNVTNQISDIGGEMISGGKLLSEVIKIAIEKGCSASRNNHIGGLLHHLLIFKSDPQKFREEIVWAGLNIFQSFEHQFMQSTCENNTWEMAMLMYAEDLVNRVLDYLAKNREKQWSHCSITEGALKGKSKTLKNISKEPGFSLKNDWNTAKVFDKTGLVTVKSDGTPDKYYKHSKTNCQKYGFRRPLNFELEDSINWMVKLNNKYKETKPPREEYKYLMVTDDIPRLQKEILDLINKADPDLCEERLHEHIHNSREDAKQDALEIWKELEKYVSNEEEIMQKIHEHMISESERACTYRKQEVEKTNTILRNTELLVSRQQNEGTNPNSVCFELNDPLSRFVLRRNKLDEIKKGLEVDKKFVVVAGLSGMGKTELARQYARDHCATYNGNIIWIDASNKTTSIGSFQRLAKNHLNIKLPDKDSEDISMVVAKVYKYFSNTKSIFIFDSAECSDMIEEFLPRNLCPNQREPNVLITSQIRDKWDTDRGTNYDIIQLNELTDDEAVRYVKSVLENEEDDVIRVFANGLHKLPWNLAQVVTLIKNTNDKVPYTIKNYMKGYKNKDLKCISPEKIVATACGKIENKKSIELLDVLAFLHPENISGDLIKNTFTAGADDALVMVTDELSRWSLAELQNNIISLHSLVQEGRREMLSKNPQMPQKSMQKCLNMLKNKIKKRRDDFYQYVPHVVSIWLHAHEYKDLINEFIVKDIVESKKNHLSYFHIIASSSTFEVINRIVSNIEKHNPDQLTNIINADDGQGGRPLHYAVPNDLKVVSLLVNKGAVVNVQTKHGWSPLHLAVKNGKGEHVKFLLENGALISAETEYKFTPLHLAARQGDSSIVEILLDSGADVNARDQNMFTPLHFAAKENHQKVLNQLLDWPEVEVDACTCIDSKTPLMYAVTAGHLKCVEALLQKGANVNACTKDNFTSLLLAARKSGSEEVASVLLKREDIDVNFVTSMGNTALHIAAEFNNFEMVKALKAKNAKVDVKNKNGQLASEMASEKEFIDIVNFLK